jgi:hypothetical protein
MHDAGLIILNSLAKRHRAGMAPRAHHEGAATMAGVRDYTDAELEFIRKSFGGGDALRDHCYEGELHDA